MGLPNGWLRTKGLLLASRFVDTSRCPEEQTALRNFILSPLERKRKEYKIWIKEQQVNRRAVRGGTISSNILSSPIQ